MSLELQLQLARAKNLFSDMFPVSIRSCVYVDK